MRSAVAWRSALYPIGIVVLLMAMYFLLVGIDLPGAVLALCSLALLLILARVKPTPTPTVTRQG